LSRVSPVDYWMLAELRCHIRRFLRPREVAARAAGIEPQHYLLLQVEPTTAGEAILERLALQSLSELRAEGPALVAALRRLMRSAGRDAGSRVGKDTSTRRT
jgi:hypothetical protein